jgi:hypothetical protein
MNADTAIRHIYEQWHEAVVSTSNGTRQLFAVMSRD